MKIKSLFFNRVGPLRDQKIELHDSWTDTISPQVLFSGPNGTGKSIILRMVAMLWEASGYWLDQQKKMPKSQPARGWLSKWGGCGIILDEVFEGSGPIGLIFGERKWVEKIRGKEAGIRWMGEIFENGGKGNRTNSIFFGETGDETPIPAWAELRKKLILTFEAEVTPNVVYLDAEERRWVTPKRGVGKPAAEDSQLRWLIGYRVSEEWQGQLEASLITLKTSKLHSFHETVRKLNDFLYGKEIDTDIRTGENRLRVKLKNGRGQFHYLDDLSAGEHQVIIQLYLLHRWLEPGGIVLIDEPDLHLHPSLVPGLLAALETQVMEKKGQLLLTSHLPDIWNRYESIGQRISLGGTL